MSPRDSVHLYALARVEQPVSARVGQPVGNSQAAFVGWLRRRR